MMMHDNFRLEFGFILLFMIYDVLHRTLALHDGSSLNQIYKI